jgi:hypothetical protein
MANTNYDDDDPSTPSMRLQLQHACMHNFRNIVFNIIYNSIPFEL